ncbi:MAG: hypothetical protein BJ554DRAFT_8378, partial [Olpidium bornovanus]
PGIARGKKTAASVRVKCGQGREASGSPRRLLAQLLTERLLRRLERRRPRCPERIRLLLPRIGPSARGGHPERVDGPAEPILLNQAAGRPVERPEAAADTAAAVPLSSQDRSPARVLAVEDQRPGTKRRCAGARAAELPAERSAAAAAAAVKPTARRHARDWHRCRRWRLLREGVQRTQRVERLCGVTRLHGVGDHSGRNRARNGAVSRRRERVQARRRYRERGTSAEEVGASWTHDGVWESVRSRSRKRPRLSGGVYLVAVVARENAGRRLRTETRLLCVKLRRAQLLRKRIVRRERCREGRHARHHALHICVAKVPKALFSIKIAAESAEAGSYDLRCTRRSGASEWIVQSCASMI